MVANSALSSKALGKRPATKNNIRNNGIHSVSPIDAPTSPVDMSASAAGPSATPTRQKRILPTRTRRGGTGFGTCDADQLILDGVLRKGESEPLIPASTIFVLTTDSSLVPPESEDDLGLNSLANERYFERPEVIQALKEQQEIQTPEYTALTDDARVGGRLRVRGEEETPDLSDAAYERRHRKFETHEKRQKLREKEKLQHDHYKLKERIEVLRGLDSSAFMNLPSSTFRGWHREPPDDEGEGEETAEPPATADEGEWRRQIVLEVATSLEERYRFLLPNEKKAMEKARLSISMSADVEPSVIDDGGMEEDGAEMEEDEVEVEEDGVEVEEGGVEVEEERGEEQGTELEEDVIEEPEETPEETPEEAEQPEEEEEEEKEEEKEEETLEPEANGIEEVVETSTPPFESASASSVAASKGSRRVTLRLPPPPSPTTATSKRPRRKRSLSQSVEYDQGQEREPEVEQDEALPEPEPEPAELPEPNAVEVIQVDEEPVKEIQTPIPLRQPRNRKRDTEPKMNGDVILSVNAIPDDIPMAQSHFMTSWRINPVPVEAPLPQEPLPSVSAARKRQRVTPRPPKPSADERVEYSRAESPAQSMHNPPPPRVRPEPNGASVSHGISKYTYDSISSMSTGGRRQPMPAILVAASHNEGPESRKTSRTLMAFGVKLPTIENMEFEPPEWLDLPFEEAFANAGPPMQNGILTEIHDDT